MSRGEAWQRALIAPANYQMKVIGREFRAGRECGIFELTPLAKSTHLLKGRAWMDIHDYSLVRIEGKPSASPSFWTGHPMIVREYENIDGLPFAIRSYAVSESLLLGKTELTIEYTDYKVTVR